MLGITLSPLGAVCWNPQPKGRRTGREWEFAPTSWDLEEHASCFNSSHYSPPS